MYLIKIIAGKHVFSKQLLEPKKRLLYFRFKCTSKFSTQFYFLFITKNKKTKRKVFLVFI